MVQTPMFNDINYWDHWLRHVIPPTTEKEVADGIVEGLQTEEPVVTVPGRMALVGLLYHLIPLSISDVLMGATGASTLLASRKKK